MKLNSQISMRDHIKVADLGLATCKHMITGTVCGTPLYMAPEVKEAKTYDSRADMYSFGLMMWEMWFGEKVSRDLSYMSAEKVSRRVGEKCRRGNHVPPTEWVELMSSCWNHDPCVRRTATESKALIIEMKQKYAKKDKDDFV